MSIFQFWIFFTKLVENLKIKNLIGGWKLKFEN